MNSRDVSFQSLNEYPLLYFGFVSESTSRELNSWHKWTWSDDCGTHCNRKGMSAIGEFICIITFGNCHYLILAYLAFQSPNRKEENKGQTIVLDSKPVSFGIVVWRYVGRSDPQRGGRQLAGGTCLSVSCIKSDLYQDEANGTHCNDFGNRSSKVQTFTCRSQVIIRFRRAR